jgi:hypothetical protein
VREHAVDGFGNRRVDREDGLVARAEHEVVDEQLGALVEKLDERLLTLIRVEAILLLHSHPRQLASKLGEVVAEPGVLFFAGEQLLACGEPLVTCSDSAISRLLSHLFLSGWS